MIVDGLQLDLGLTSKELQIWFYQQLTAVLGEAHPVQIVDIDTETGGSNSVIVELATNEMVADFKKLDGVVCLGEPIQVRKQGEETHKTSAQAAVIALKALNMITGHNAESKEGKEKPPEEEDVQLGPQTLEAKGHSLRSL
jgi:hypothetical protein